MAKSKGPQVGQMVTYRGRDGMKLPALVTMTVETYDATADPSGTRKPADDTSVSLTVFRISGRFYARHNVPAEGSDAHEALIAAKDEFDAKAAEGLPEGVTLDDLKESAEEAGDEYPGPAAPVVRSWAPLAP